MARRLPTLTSLRAFEAAARHMSFKRAAAELNVTATAISHHVRALEQDMGIMLFERHARRIVLTAEAQILFPVLRDGFDSFAGAVEIIERNCSRASVTLSATTAFSAQWLLPRMSGFRSSCPGIDLHLLATDEAVDLDAGRADLAIRYVNEPPAPLVCRRLFTDRFAPVASPGLKMRKPVDLKSATLIHFDWHRSDPSNPTWARWFSAARIRGVDLRSGIRFSDESHAIQSAIAGHGVALLSLRLVEQELASQTLVVPFGPELQSRSYYLVHSRKYPLNEAARTVYGWLLQTAAGSAAAASASAHR